jgi:hypothetical protein
MMIAAAAAAAFAVFLRACVVQSIRKNRYAYGFDGERN